MTTKKKLHELSNANLRRVFGKCRCFPCVVHGMAEVEVSHYAGRWCLCLWPIRKGRRTLCLQVSGIDFSTRLPLGTISTLDELVEWYERLSAAEARVGRLRRAVELSNDCKSSALSEAQKTHWLGLLPGDMEE